MSRLLRSPGAAILAALLALACGRGKASADAHRADERREAAPSAAGRDAAAPPGDLRLGHEIKVKDGSDQELFTLEPRDDGAKLVRHAGGGKEELARLKIKGDRLKIKGPGDQELGFAEPRDGRVKLVDAAGKELFVLHREDDGDWRLEDGAHARLWECKRREDGFDAKDPSGAERFKVRIHGEKTSVRKADGTSILETKDPVAPLALLTLAFPELSDPQKAAVLAAASAGGMRQ